MMPLPPITGGAGGSAGPSSSGLNGSSGFDSGNWTVSTGSSSASSFDLKTLLILGAVLLAGVLAWKKL